MSQAAALLDTDILSELLKRHPQMTHRTRVYLAEHNRLTFSIITRYEILRSLKAKQAQAQEIAFDALCQACVISKERPALTKCGINNETPVGSIRYRQIQNDDEEALGTSEWIGGTITGDVCPPTSIQRGFAR